MDPEIELLKSLQDNSRSSRIAYEALDAAYDNFGKVFELFRSARAASSINTTPPDLDAAYNALEKAFESLQTARANAHAARQISREAGRSFGLSRRKT